MKTRTALMMIAGALLAPPATAAREGEDVGGGAGAAAQPLWKLHLPGYLAVVSSADRRVLQTMIVSDGADEGAPVMEAVCVDANGVIRWRFSDPSGRDMWAGTDCLSADGAFAVVQGFSKDPKSGELVETAYVLDANGKPVSQILLSRGTAMPSISRDGRLILSVDPDTGRVDLYRRDGTHLWGWQDVKPVPGEHGAWLAAIAGRGEGVVAWAEDGTLTYMGLDGKRWWEIATGWLVDIMFAPQLRLSSAGDAFLFYANGPVKIPRIEPLRDFPFHTHFSAGASTLTQSTLLGYKLLPLDVRDAGRADLSELIHEYSTLSLDQAGIRDAGIEAAGKVHVIYVDRPEGVELIKVVPDRPLERVLLPGTRWDGGERPMALSEDGRYLAVAVQGEPQTPAARDRKLLLFDNSGRPIGAILLPKGGFPDRVALVVSGALRRVFFRDGDDLVCYAFPR